MKIKFKFYKGEDNNPFDAERDNAIDAFLKAHDDNADGIENDNDYIAANSKCVFWDLEKMLQGEVNAEKVEKFWNDTRIGDIPKFINEKNVDDATKALVLYMIVEFTKFSPNDNTVDFELYFA